MTTNSLDLKILIAKYLEYCEVDRNLSQNTIKMYHFYLTDFISWIQKITEHENPRITDLDYDLIKKYRVDLNRRISSRSHEELKKSTQKTFLVALRAFLKYLVQEEDISILSPDKVVLGKPEAGVPKVLNREQLLALFGAQNLSKRSGLRDRAILELLFSTGTRNDDFSPLFLRYSGRSMGENDIDGESLRLTVRSVQRLVKKYVVRAGISVDATPHTLRHSFATGLLREGADLRSVQELLGHSNVSTTQIYTHVTNLQLKEAHKKFHKDPQAVVLD
ncbi:MAG: Tyrosine recombinase XerC [candidate division WWE3 bacterium GW2011_GWB1_47_11]|uniref:Tyrosine recombinase XerC n=2 Tax=Katanobacteria TaxID=422282 RepID=A0A0G1UGV3_UNCKA|nr:MAG: Tyrosine recombinase XerC [candidate division WWE3 bacterium GW2011_GWB1_47_11]